MQLLALTDIHGALPDVDYDDLDYDAVLLNGDLGFTPEQRNAIREADRTESQAIVEDMVDDVHTALDDLTADDAPVYTVPGNWDLALYDALIAEHNVHDLEAEPVTVDGVRLAGYGAHETPTRPELPLYREDMDRYPDRWEREHTYWQRHDHLHDQLTDANGPTVVLAHNSPYGTGLDEMHDGRHIGSIVLRDAIDDHQPDYVISGHVHEAAGREQMGDTTAINGGERGAILLDLDAGTATTPADSY